MTDRVWTDAEYDAMAWHDTAIHGLRFIEGQDGCGEFVLDIDYITECNKVGDHFNVFYLPATLTFHGVFHLRMTLDYVSHSFTPFTIDGIERRADYRPGHIAYIWKIPINCPGGEITFEATGFEQRSRGEPRLSNTAALKPDER